MERAFRKAGGRPDRQPPTRNLLGKVFDNSELAALFPGGVTQEESKKRGKLAMDFLDALHQPPSRARDDKIAHIKELLPTAHSGRMHTDTNGVIRFDVCLPGTQPADGPRELWLDHVLVHETSDSYQAGVLKHLRENKKPHLAPPFRKWEQDKKNRFGALIRVAERLAREGFLGSRPFFLFPVVSSLGSMNTDMTKTLKWIADRYKDTLRPAPDTQR